MHINGDKKDSKALVGLLTPNQRRIQAFILMLVPNVSDAEDIYQETVLEMWNKFDDFQVGTDFVAWAVTIAKFKVMTFRRKNLNSKIQFSSKVAEMLESAAGAKIGRLQDHIDVLRDCFRKLSEQEVMLLKLRYEDCLTFQEISSRTSKTSSAMHRIMALIHSKLALCIRRVLRLEEMA